MKEKRFFSESAEIIDDNEMIIEGYAIVFESPATHGYTEIIDRNALNNTDMSDVVLKYNHSDTNYILARTRNHSLELLVDEHGLKIRAKLIDTTTNRDVFKMIKSGLIDKQSFAFTISEEEWDYETNTRRILAIDKLFDVSVVSEPFYDSTEIYARSLEEYEKEKMEYLNKKLDIQKRKLKMKLMLK